MAFGSTLAEESTFSEPHWVERTERGATSRTNAQWVADDPELGLVGSSVLAEADGVVNVFAMWVDPRRRGLHLGARLLDAALGWGAEVFPGRSIRLDLNPRQEVAARLYASRGFRPTGTRRALGHTDGEVAIELMRPPPA